MVAVFVQPTQKHEWRIYAKAPAVIAAYEKWISEPRDLFLCRGINSGLLFRLAAYDEHAAELLDKGYFRADLFASGSMRLLKYIPPRS